MEGLKDQNKESEFYPEGNRELLKIFEQGSDIARPVLVIVLVAVYKINWKQEKNNQEAIAIVQGYR